MASIVLDQEMLTCHYPDGKMESHSGPKLRNQVPALLSDFASGFEYENLPFSFPSNGLFGYMTYDMVQYLEDIQLFAPSVEKRSIPDMQYYVYRYIIVVDHFREELYLFDHAPDSEEGGGLEYLEALLHNRSVATYHFTREGEEESNLTDAAYRNLVDKAKTHCRRGDVFQLVLSRSFSQGYTGDDFNVYRALRSVNPSPYLFYFDYGNFRLFGSSPEAQLVIRNAEASIHPIAGTFKRTGNDQADAGLAEKLKLDPKENAEHVMLVDLARNDLSRDCNEVAVEKFREIQYYSHVIHLVSKVSGKLKSGHDSLKLVASTFPAGTLSGAPKHMAMQLIDRYEPSLRGFYGGAIGIIGFNGDFNHAILIRSFLSKDKQLFYQAGAGIVESSSEENELQEVNNKLAALKRAIERAEEI